MATLETTGIELELGAARRVRVVLTLFVAINAGRERTE